LPQSAGDEKLAMASHPRPGWHGKWLRGIVLQPAGDVRHDLANPAFGHAHALLPDTGEEPDDRDFGCQARAALGVGRAAADAIRRRPE
jgi:hypothetical protein